MSREAAGGGVLSALCSAVVRVADIVDRVQHRAPDTLALDSCSNINHLSLSRSLAVDCC